MEELARCGAFIDRLAPSARLESLLVL